MIKHGGRRKKLNKPGWRNGDWAEGQKSREIKQER